MTEELNEAGKHLQEAGKKFGDLLTEALDGAREGSYAVRKELTEAYRQSLIDAWKRLEQWNEDAREESEELRQELANKIAKTQEKLEELKEATAENWEAARRAFNVAWQELRDAYEKAKAEFEKRPGEGSPE